MRRSSTLATLTIVAHVLARPAASQAVEIPTCNSPTAALHDSTPIVLPVAIRSNHFVITVCRGDRPLTFVLDTGAGASVIDLSVARELGIEIGRGFEARGAGGGTSASASIRRDSVRVAGTNIVVSFGTAIDFGSISAAGRLKIDGILGADFIDRFVLGLSYRDSVMRVYDRATFAYSGSGVAVPFTMARRFIYVDGVLGLADGAKVPGRFVVDVGASGALALTKPFVDANRLRERSGPTIRRPAGRGVGGVVTADIGRAQTLTIGSVTLEHPIIMLNGDSSGVFASSSLGDGNIGGDILRRFTVLLDYRKQQLIFERHAGSDEPFEVDMTGITMTPSAVGSALVVESVVAGSSAASAGLVVGDTIVAIDHKPATLVELDTVRPRMLREGERFVFTVRRKGANEELIVLTKRLV